MLKVESARVRIRQLYRFPFEKPSRETAPEQAVNRTHPTQLQSRTTSLGSARVRQAV
jgi:hypothetical protein